MPNDGFVGLYVFVQLSGSKAFALRCGYNGKSKKLTFGKFTELSLREAQQKTRKALESISDGEYKAGQPTAL